MATRMDCWTWLRELEKRHLTVATYMRVHRSGVGLDAQMLPGGDLAPATLLGLVDCMVTVELGTRARLESLIDKSIYPPVMALRGGGMCPHCGGWVNPPTADLAPGGVNPVFKSIPPRDIYFVDFLRSLWKRLTRL